MNAFGIVIAVGAACAAYDLLVVVPLITRMFADDNSNGMSFAATAMSMLIPPLMVLVMSFAMVVLVIASITPSLYGLYGRFRVTVAGL